MKNLTLNEPEPVFHQALGLAAPTKAKPVKASESPAPLPKPEPKAEAGKKDKK